MEPTNTAVFVLKIILAIGPLALYFLILGLLNSQARPCLVSARLDFALLTVAFVPVIAMPLLVLFGQGSHQLVSVIVLGFVGLFCVLLPRRDHRWVVYNCSPAQCRRLLHQVARRMGWRVVSSQEGTLTVEPLGLHLTQSALPLLRSVTLHVHAQNHDTATSQLIAALKREVRAEAMLPSATGVSFVVVGAALLGLPMWYFFHHFDVIVEVVRRIFSA